MPHKTKTVYLFDNERNLIGEYKSASKLGIAIGISTSCAFIMIRRQSIYNGKFYASNFPNPIWEARKLNRNPLETFYAMRQNQKIKGCTSLSKDIEKGLFLLANTHHLNF